MFSDDLKQNNLEYILLQIEEMGYPFPQFELTKINDSLVVLGRGGFSVVYEVKDKEKKRQYALKVMGLERHNVTSKKFWETIRVQKILENENDNIARVISARELNVKLGFDGRVDEIKDVAEGNDRWSDEGIVLQFILMDKLERIIDTDKFNNVSLTQDKLIDESKIINFANQIGGAIDCAHKNNVLHRDIKLENIFWNDKSRIYVLGDFGIAKQLENGNTDTIIYTDGYGAPEIEKRLAKSYNTTADIYSFGITLYLLLNNLRFPGSQGYCVNMQQYEADFVFPAPENASVNMTRIVRKMCSYEPENRYQSIGEALHDINMLSSEAECVQNLIELQDGETETYRTETHKKQDNSFKDDDYEDENFEDENFEDENYEYDEQIDEYLKKIVYRESLIKFGIAFLIFGFLFIIGDKNNAGDDWNMWIFPVVLLIETILLHIKEFHVSFGIASVVLTAYSIYMNGLTLTSIFVLLCVVSFFPTITGTGTLVLVLRNVCTLLNLTNFFGFIHKFDIVWIFFTVLLYLLIKCDDVLFTQMTDKHYILRSGLWDKIMIIMMIMGIVLWILGKMGKVDIPDIIRSLHFIRTSCVAFVVRSIVVTVGVSRYQKMMENDKTDD